VASTGEGVRDLSPHTTPTKRHRGRSAAAAHRLVAGSFLGGGGAVAEAPVRVERRGFRRRRGDDRERPAGRPAAPPVASGLRAPAMVPAAVGPRSGVLPALPLFVVGGRDDQPSRLSAVQRRLDGAPDTRRGSAARRQGGGRRTFRQGQRLRPGVIAAPASVCGSACPAIPPVTPSRLALPSSPWRRARRARALRHTGEAHYAGPLR